MEAHAHCWHRSNFQHAVPNHRDETCCHCGETSCIRLPPPEIPAGHGPYCPERVSRPGVNVRIEARREHRNDLVKIITTGSGKERQP